VGRALLAQFALLVHPTHVFVVVSQMGCVADALQSVFPRHWTQVLVAVSQTSPSLVQLAALPVVHWTQVKVVVSQTVRWPPCAAHSPLLTHWTQVPALQNGVGSLQPVVAPVHAGPLSTGVPLSVAPPDELELLPELEPPELDPELEPLELEPELLPELEAPELDPELLVPLLDPDELLPPDEEEEDVVASPPSSPEDIASLPVLASDASS
jgi:hypothetical protein